MIKSWLAILFLVYSCSSNWNKNSPANPVAYKEMEAPPPLPKSIRKTDSSIIETVYHEDLNSIREFNELNSSHDYYYTEYRFANKTIVEKGLIKDGNSSGIWKYYDEQGTILKEINFDTGDKKLFNGNTEPYDELFVQMKSKADRVLIDYFGRNFFYSNLQCNFNNSYFFTANTYGSWFQIPKEKPEQFKFSYFILFDNNLKLSSIEFTLNSEGKMIDSIKSKGLSKCNTASCTFQINYLEAIQIARQNGIEPGEEPEHFYLEWNKLPDSYLGYYQLVILELKEKKQFNKRVSYYYYEGILLNPYDGQVIRKTEFYEMHSNTMHCSYSSGKLERKNKGVIKEIFEMAYNQYLSVL